MYGIPRAIVCIAVLAAWAAWWWRGRPAGVGTVLLAIVASWTLTLDSGWRRLSGVSSYEPPAVLSLEVLTKSPRAPLAVVVYKRGHGSRPYYEPAFRSEHPLRFVQPGPELREWIQQHPEGFVLLRKKDRMETPSTGVRTVAETRNWLVQQGPSIGADRPRKLPGLRGKSPAPGGAPGRPGGDGSERPPGAQEAADPSEE